jgi:serine protease AprX
MSAAYRIRPLVVAFAVFILSATTAFAQAVVDAELQGVFARLGAGGPTEVIVTFQGDRGPAAAELEVLRAVGITGGITLKNLPMAGVLATQAQVDALARNPRVRSVFWNKPLQSFNYDARHLTGVERLRGDAAMTRQNRGLPVSGKGVGVVVIDNGVDATHPDLQLGRNVVQNVLAVADRNLIGSTGFVSMVVAENQPTTSYAGDHGTHVAGTVGGSGQASSGRHAGMAPGASLIGYGIGAPLLVLNTLGGFDWSLANQAQYGIRVITNSWGSSGGFNPDHPINVASRIASEQRNIVVLFAAGNSGPGLNTINPYAKAPWVISVAAGDKASKLAGFSSRGTPGGAKTATSSTGETITWLDEPTITAPGVGIVSARAIAGTPETGNVFYNTKSGTSMATPATAGIVALILEANPLLTPREVTEILRQTATRMPGYRSHEVGAGYVNAFAAVQKAFTLSTPFGATLQVRPVAGSVREDVLVERTFDYSPVALPGTYRNTFTVTPGASVLEVKIQFDGLQLPVYGNAGNPLLLDVRDPNGVRYTAFDLYFALFGTRQLGVVVNNPVAGTWTAEVKALTPLGNEAGNFATFPDRITQTITLTTVSAPSLSDVPASHPAKGAIDFGLVNGFIALCGTSSFCPDRAIRRVEFARAFTQFGAVRQFLPLGGGSTFTDVSAADRPFVEAAAARGAAMRDAEFRFGGVIEGNGSSFNPSGSITRAEIARMLVRGVGGDAAALAHTGDVTIQHDGRRYVLTDQDQIPAALRGYVQVAINSNMLNVFWSVQQGPLDLQPTLQASFRPTGTMTRADAAVAITRYYAQFFR